MRFKISSSNKNKKIKMASQWILHVKKVSKEKGIPYNEALKVAGKTFKKKDEKPAGRAKAPAKAKAKKDEVEDPKKGKGKK